MSKYAAVIKKMQEQIIGDLVAHLGQHDLDVIKVKVELLRKENAKLREKIKAMEVNNPH